VGEGSKFYAHTPVEGGDWHDLVSHLRQTAERARKNAEKFGAGELAYLAGLWHDLGKFNPAFQKYLLDCREAALAGDRAPRGGSVPHAVYGAALAAESVQSLAAVIYGHHAGLPDRDRYGEALKQPEMRKMYGELLPAARDAVEDLDFRGDARGLLSDPPRNELQAEVLQRMLFSSLVDADFLDTETHFDPGIGRSRGSAVSVDEMWEVLRRDQDRLMSGPTGNGSSVNSVRREVYENCVAAAGGDPGVFRLAVPTGGGKTRSGLAFALKHAAEHDLDRVIVAVPYTSIIEQTADVYRGVFSDLDPGAVLEHHSAVRREGKDGERQDEARVRAKLASENWDAPLVVTTTVQLFESLFANRTSRCRKLHNIARSVIVLDEVQTLPVSLLAPTVDMLAELTRRYGVTVVLCTATQPALDERSRYLQGFQSVRDIVPTERALEHFRVLQRVEYETPSEEWAWHEIAERLVAASPKKQAMVVLNTRKDTLTLLDELEGEPVLHLSTLLCGAHRRDVLAEVKRRLKAGEPCLLVATQVVEAGVDLDFPVVFRAMGPLDRIVQAAGRCNREGKLDGHGRVVVFKPEQRRTPKGEYEAGFREAEIMIGGGADLHDPSIFRDYFRRLYQDIPTDGRNVQKLRKEFDYPEVAARYRLVSENSVPVVVRYGAGGAEGGKLDRLLKRIRRTGLWGGDHRRLQSYVVSMFEEEFKKNREWADEVAEGVFVWTGGYDGLRGIEQVETDPTALIW
jgi:CRISPR-associated endonuclease/helicase Cas3